MQPTYLPYADINLLPTYEMAFVQDAFNSICQDWAIEFGFPHGGCQQRAQVMSLVLQKKFNMQHCKVWLFAPAALYLDNPQMISRKDGKDLSPNGLLEWSYHVAPIVRVKHNDSVETYVIDPAINNQKLLHLQEWFNALDNCQIGNYCFVLPDKYFFNSSYHTGDNFELTTLFDGSFFNYENPAKDNLAVEKGMAIQDMVKTIYHAHILPLMSSINDADKKKLHDLKDIFGNATALDLLFSQNISGYSDNTTMRYVLTHHDAIIEEAKSLFNQRLFYWTKIVNGILQ
jgi:hypothetical protein